jgi:asparagine synthase (glutamine-hydrolysing)
VCGIAGALTHLGQADAKLRLQAMVTALTHRGPDDHGIEMRQAGSVVAGLCATRLAIRDPSPRGHQPMVGPTGSILALNGEIYNARALRSSLESRRHSFHSESDTEVALRAYEEWGIGCVERLEGMFAIAVWDPRQESLLLARDRLGIKPLYYAQPNDRELLFASELRAILPHLGRPARVSECGVMSYLATGAVVEPETMIEGITMLPPGHLAAWQSDRLDVRRYWSLEEAFLGDVPHLTPKAMTQELRERLESAVSAQLVSDAPLAVFLSGGMDSSALVGLASRVTPHPPSTASIVFVEAAYSEAPHIYTVRTRFQTDHHEIALTGEDFLREIPAALGAMDQPTSDGVNTYVVSKLARQAGFTVVLSGLGGDELFGGYGHFRTIPRLEALRKWIPPPLTGPAAALGRLRYGDGDRSRKLARWLQGEVEDPLELQRELFEPDIRAELFPSGQPASARQAQRRLDDRINAISVGELEGYMLNVLLRDSDVMSMAHGLELRVPLLDERIVDFVARIPGCHKVTRGRNKPLLADAAADLLPPQVCSRKKGGFVLPFADWMRRPLRNEVEEKLLDEHYGGLVADLLDSEAVATTWRSYCGGTSTWHRPWALYVLKAWGEGHRHQTSNSFDEGKLRLASGQP